MWNCGGLLKAALQYILDPIVSKQISLFKGMFYLYLIMIQTHLGPWQTGFSIFKFGLDFAEIFKLLRNFAVCIPPIEEGFKQKPRQMSSHLFGGQILINSLPRKVCILPRSIWKKFNRFINRVKIASAARNWIKSDPKQTWRPLPWLLLVPGLFEQPVTVIMLSPRVSGASGHLGFYWIPTYCLICVYHPVRAIDQFNHWLNSTWHRFCLNPSSLIPPLSPSPQCASHRRVWLRGVHHIGESSLSNFSKKNKKSAVSIRAKLDSVVGIAICITPRGQSPVYTE